MTRYGTVVIGDVLKCANTTTTTITDTTTTTTKTDGNKNLARINDRMWNCSY